MRYAFPGTNPIKARKTRPASCLRCGQFLPEAERAVRQVRKVQGGRGEVAAVGATASRRGGRTRLPARGAGSGRRRVGEEVAAEQGEDVLAQGPVGEVFGRLFTQAVELAPGLFVDAAEQGGGLEQRQAARRYLVRDAELGLDAQQQGAVATVESPSR